MFCKNCGRQIPDDAAFCPGCGTKRHDSETSADRRSSANIRNLPNYAKDIDRSGHAVDSDRKKFSLSDPDRKKFSLSDSGRDKFSLFDKSSKGDDGGIVRLTSNREQPAPAKESAAQSKEPAGFVNPLKDSGGTIFRSGETSGTNDSGPTKDATDAGTAKDIAPDPTKKFQQEKPAPREPDAVIEEDESSGGFVNPLKDAGLDIQLGSDGDRNQPAEDIGEINSPHLKFAIWMVILSCTCCNPVTLILGIIAIIFAFQVATCSRSGNLAIALQKAMVARVLCWITFGLLAVWISLLVAMLCLPMPEDRRSTQEVQTEQVEDESSTQETQTEQAEVEGSKQEVQTEHSEVENVEASESNHHHSNLGLLLDILD